MESKTVHIPAISCGHCVATIKREIGEVAGVQSVEGDPGSKEVTISWHEPASWQSIADTLKELGYPPG